MQIQNINKHFHNDRRFDAPFDHYGRKFSYGVQFVMLARGGNDVTLENCRKVLNPDTPESAT